MTVTLSPRFVCTLSCIILLILMPLLAVLSILIEIGVISEMIVTLIYNKKPAYTFLHYSVDLLDFLVDVCFPMFLNQEKSSPSKSLLAMAVGIKQKEIVNQIVEKVMNVPLLSSCVETFFWPYGD